MLRTRVLTAAVALPVLLGMLWLGPPYFTLLVGLASLVGHLEFYRLARLAGLAPFAALGTAGGLTLVAAAALERPEAAGPILAGEALLAGFGLALRGKTAGALGDWAATLGGTIYCGLIFSYYIRLRGLPAGFEWSLVTFLVTFVVDTAAFFVGRRLGRHRLAATISPNKTVEGFLSGLAAGPLTAAALCAVLGLPLGWWAAAGLGLGLAFAGQVGDLAESAFKRSAGVKDSGRLFPGHGGLLDRVDSLAFNGVVAFYLISGLISGIPRG
jgi:phosphatidate cytidylyltransferase